jgi:hypothetical protein
MRFDIKRQGPEWALRIGLGILYLYTGYTLMKYPTSWKWALNPLPHSLRVAIQNFGDLKYLVTQGVVEFIFGLSLLLWFLPRTVLRVVSFLITLQMAAILLLVGFTADTFRDLAILAGGLSLFISSFTKL